MWFNPNALYPISYNGNGTTGESLIGVAPAQLGQPGTNTITIDGKAPPDAGEYALTDSEGISGSATMNVTLAD